MKRKLLLVLAMMLLACSMLLLTGCGPKKDASPDETSEQTAPPPFTVVPETTQPDAVDGGTDSADADEPSAPPTDPLPEVVVEDEIIIDVDDTEAVGGF